MEQFFPVLSDCPLFSGLKRDDILFALSCLHTVQSKVPRGTAVFHEGDPVRYTGIVLSGVIQISRTDYTGNRIIVMSALPGELFGEVHMIAGMTQAPASAVAAQDSYVLLFDGKKLLSGCENDCLIHRRISENLMRSVARKNIALNNKIYFITRRTTREKLLAFLMDQSRQQGKREFTISYDRQALADYLSVDRSALSTEISKLKKAGLIDCTGSRFCIRWSDAY